MCIQFANDPACITCVQGAGLYMPEEICRQAGKRGDATYAVTPTGLDQVQFLLGAGPGEPLRPLSDVASGGESARIMLALKAAPVAAIDLSQQANGAAADSFPGACNMTSKPAQPVIVNTWHVRM